MIPDFAITQGDSGPPWLATLGDEQNDTFDLTTATSLVLDVWDQITNTALPLVGAVSASSATVIRFDPNPADFATVKPGFYAVKWRVTFAGATGPISFPAGNQILLVRAAPPTP